MVDSADGLRGHTQSAAFKSAPLSYQEARIYAFHQSCDRMIGAGNVPENLRVDPVIGEEWVWPGDPRTDQMRAQMDAAQEAAE